MCWVGARFFFKEFEVNGRENIPKDAGYILALNHPNSFLDAILCGVSSPPSLYYLTRSDVFVSPWDMFLESIQMMPVYRMRDGIKKLAKNEDTFKRCYELIDNDSGVLIFSEANTAKEYSLRPISKGTARLAINAQLACAKPMYILPAGISYVNHDHSGHKVFLNYGQPISISKYLAEYENQAPVTLNKLKADVTEAIKNLLIIPEKDDHYDDKAQVIQQYGDMCSYDEITKLITDYERITTSKKPKRANWLLGLISIPHWPIFYLISSVLKEIKDPQFVLSVKFLVSVLVLPLYWLLIFILVIPFLGFWISLVVVGSLILSLLIRAQLK